MIKALYIHIPFCDSICPYCDFNKRVSNDDTQKEYLEKLKEEIDYNSDSFNDLETIFIGGGTPTAFNYLEELLIHLSKYINLKNIKEFTIETTIDRALRYKDIYSKFGVNRISIGVESFNKRINEYLGRKNNKYLYLKKIIKELREVGISNINLDLIFSLPYSNRYTVKEDLLKIEKLNVEHVSFYDLIIENKTKLSYDLDNNLIELPDVDESVKMRDLIDKYMPKFGYHQYEISNWSKDGYESIHNKSYWELKEYLGLGLGAHSQVENKRFSNPTSLKTYALTNSKEEYLSNRVYYEFEKDKEYFMLGLRLIKGVSLTKYKEEFGIDPLDKFKGINKLIDSGLLMIENDYLHLTKRGRDLGNIVFEEFV